MIYDRFRKKTNRPANGSGSSFDAADITDQIPETDDILAEIDKALETAERIEEQFEPQSRCGC